MIRKFIFCFVIISIIKENECRFTKKREMNVNKKLKISTEEPQLRLSHGKHETNVTSVANTPVKREHKEKGHITEVKTDTALIKEVEDVKLTKSGKTTKEKNNNKPKPHILTKEKKKRDLKEDEKKKEKRGKRASNGTRRHRRRAVGSRKANSQVVTSKVLDHSTPSRPSLSTMDEVLHNKTAELIHIIQNTEISSPEDVPPNTSNNPQDNPKHERRYVIRNFDVLESYMKGRRFKKAQSLEDWSKESEVSQSEEFKMDDKKSPSKIVRYDEFSDDYIITTAKGNIADDRDPWVQFDAQTVLWDADETSGQNDNGNNENTNVEAKDVVKEDHVMNESKEEEKDYKVKRMKKKVSALHSENNSKSKTSSDTTHDSKAYHKLGHHKESKSIKKHDRNNKIIRNISNEMQASKLHHNTPNIELHAVKNQQHRQQETKKYKLKKSKKTKEQKKKIRMARRWRGDMDSENILKQLPSIDIKEKHKIQRPINSIRKITTKSVKFNTNGNNTTDHNVNSFIKRTIDTIARNNNASIKRKKVVRTLSDYNKNDNNPSVNNKTQTVGIKWNASNKTKSIDIQVKTKLSKEISKIMNNNTEVKEKSSEKYAIHRTENMYDASNNEEDGLNIENSLEERNERNDLKKLNPYDNGPVDMDYTQLKYKKSGRSGTDPEEKTLNNEHFREKDFQSNNKEAYENDYHSNRKDDYKDDFNFNKKDHYKDELHSNKKDDYKDDFNFNKKDHYQDEFHSNKKEDYNDDFNFNEKDHYKDEFHSNKKDDYKDEFNSNKKHDFKDDYHSNEKQSHGYSNKKISNDWADSGEKQSNKYDNIKKHKFSKERNEDNKNNDRHDTENTWDRHANNNWDDVGVRDVKSDNKAVTRRTTKRFNDYKKKQPARSYNKDYRDDFKPERSYNKGYRDEGRPARSNNRGNREESKSGKPVWDPHENNNWDAVGVDDYNKRKGSGSKKWMRDNDRPSYVHTALPYKGR